MWNDTDIPLAVLFTFRSYGTWLHGDDRCSIDRHNNIYGTPRYSKLDHWEQISRERMKHDPVTLNARQRSAVEYAVRETCIIRNWGMYAINVRTNHGHVVAAVGSKSPDLVLSTFKANATSIMRERNCWQFKHSPWAEKGSKRRLWNERHLIGAIDYVMFGQGGDLPDFD